MLILAFAAVPIVLSRCKPLAKQVGQKLVQWGESLQKDAEKMDSPTEGKPSSNSNMKESRQDETLKSSSPAGKGEISEQIAADVAPKAVPSKPKATTASKKPASKPKAGTITNPKKPTTKPKAPKN